MSLWDEDEEYELLPEGVYSAVLNESKLDITGPDNVVTMVYKIVSSPGNENKKIWIRLKFNESAKKFVKWQTGVLGIGTELKECSTWNAAAEKCHEMLYSQMNKLKVELEVSHREHNGKTYENAILKEVLGTYNASDVHPGVENMALAPSFDAEEEIPF